MLPCTSFIRDDDDRVELSELRGQPSINMTSCWFKDWNILVKLKTNSMGPCRCPRISRLDLSSFFFIRLILLGSSFRPFAVDVVIVVGSFRWLFDSLPFFWNILIKPKKLEGCFGKGIKLSRAYLFGFKVYRNAYYDFPGEALQKLEWLTNKCVISVRVLATGPTGATGLTLENGNWKHFPDKLND